MRRDEVELAGVIVGGQVGNYSLFFFIYCQICMTATYLDDFSAAPFYKIFPDIVNALDGLFA
ncbi:hypothetical protein FQZ97_1269290 [compost metagenome]